MPSVPLTVVVPVTELGARATAIVRWVDGQDLPYADYQVIYLDHSVAGGEPSGLADLVTHRPNVAVVAAPTRSAALNEVLGRADGDYTLILDPGVRLQPWALRLLADKVRADGPDLVLGRSDGPGPVGFTSDVFPRPESGQSWDRAAPQAPTAALTPLFLARTGLLRSAIDSTAAAEGWRTCRIRTLAAARSVALIADPPLAVSPGPAEDASDQQLWTDAGHAATKIDDGTARNRFLAIHAIQALRAATDPAAVATALADTVRERVDEGALTALPPADRAVLAALLDGSVDDAAAAARRTVSAHVTTESAQWQDGRLHLRLLARLTRSDQTPVDDDVWIGLRLLHRGSSAGHPVTTSVESRTGDSTSSAYALTADIDISRAAAGAVLSRGMWDVQVEVGGTASPDPAVFGVPYAAAGAAIVDGLPVSTFQDKGTLRLDVGATKHGIFGAPRPEDAEITESAVGSLLTIGLPRLSVSSAATLPGHLLLDTFALPAALIADPSGASRIECYVSGLSGVSTLSAKFPPAIKQSLGLRFRIGGAGELSVDAVPKKKPASKKPTSQKPPGKEPAGKKATSKPAAAKKSGPAAGDSSAKSAPPTGAHPRTESRDYPSGRPRSLPQRILPALKPAAGYLPKPVRRRARRLYRALVK